MPQADISGKDAPAHGPLPKGSEPSEGRFLRRGKVKEVWEIGPEELEFRFTDDISVFDKIIPSQIPHKGETLARTSAHWFELCSRLGINHHFRGLPDPRRMRVRRVEVIPDASRFGPHPRRVFIPLEFVMRYYVAGSLWDRLRAGKTRPGEIGFSDGHSVQYGERLPEPLFEVTTKLEKVDRLLTPSEALQIGGITKDQMEEIRRTILRVDEGMQKEIGPRGLVHVDGKKEFAFDDEGRLMLVDTFGTADEDRFWMADGMKEGRFEEFSKEFVRQYYRSTGYHDELQAARQAGRPEPPIPPLPPELVARVSELYTGIFERLTGERFRRS
jgi:phosphoribosylaminoimidazole-succinocarboxamide synthase